MAERVGLEQNGLQLIVTSIQVQDGLSAERIESFDEEFFYNI